MTAKKERLTFKRQPKETGLRSVGHPYSNVTIKHNGMYVGNIIAPSWNTADGKWSIYVMAVYTDSSAGFVWRMILQRFGTEQEARDYVTCHTAELLNMNLYHAQPDED